MDKQTGHCRTCHKDGKLKQDGTLYNHRHLGRRWEGTVRCAGSGLKPEDTPLGAVYMCCATPRCEEPKG